MAPGEQRERRTRRPAPDALDSIGALSEPHRRALYDYVVEQRDWVSREQAAEALGLQRGIAAHHLDRLADDGLLEIDYRRLNDRRGPGAGRPAKVYRRARSEFGLSLPPRDYLLAGRLLAEAAERSHADDTPIEESLAQVARDAGRALATEATDDATGVFEVLRQRGFEPEVRDDGVTVLHNCPFHHLARAHTELVCGMNLCLLDGFLSQLDGLDMHAELAPEEGYCCVRLRPSAREEERIPKRRSG